MNRKLASLLILTALSVLSCRQAADDVPNDALCSHEVMPDTLRKLDSMVYRCKFNERTTALELARLAIRISGDAGVSGRILALNMAGNAYNQWNIDSCYHYYAAAHKLATETGYLACFPQIIYNMGVLYYQAFDFRNALIMLDSTKRTGMRIGKWEVVTDALIIVGHIKKEIGQNMEAKVSYDSAVKYASGHGLYRQLAIAMAGQAGLGDNPSRQRSIYLEAIGYLDRQPGNEEVMAGLYCNLGATATSSDSALYYYQQALKIGRSSHLNGILLSTWNNIAYSYLEKGKVTDALSIVGDSAIPLALMDSNFAELANLYDSYAEFQAASGNNAMAYRYQRMALDYRAKADNIKAGEQSRLLMALLETRDRQLMIERQKVELQKQKSRAERYRIFFLATFLGIVLLLSGFIWYRQRTRYRMSVIQLESARRIIRNQERERNNIARELHDISTGISMGLMRLIEEVPLSDISHREKLTQGVDRVRQSIRSLSHAMHSGAAVPGDLPQNLSELCNEFAREGKIQLDWAVGEHIPVVDPATAFHCSRIVGELLSNAVKHAPGRNVELDIYHADRLHIDYHDDGPGFDPSKTGETLGIVNICDRVSLMHGDVTLRSGQGEGTTWEIGIPLNTNPGKSNEK